MGIVPTLTQKNGVSEAKKPELTFFSDTLYVYLICISTVLSIILMLTATVFWCGGGGDAKKLVAVNIEIGSN